MYRFQWHYDNSTVELTNKINFDQKHALPLVKTLPLPLNIGRSKAVGSILIIIWYYQYNLESRRATCFYFYNLILLVSLLGLSAHKLYNQYLISRSIGDIISLV